MDPREKKDTGQTLPWSWFESPSTEDIGIPGVKRFSGIDSIMQKPSPRRPTVPPKGIPWEKRYKPVHYARWFQLPKDIKPYIKLMNRLSTDKKAGFVSASEQWTKDGNLVILVRYVRLVDKMLNGRKTLEDKNDDREDK